MLFAEKNSVIGQKKKTENIVLWIVIFLRECEFCHRNNLKGREIHWANKSGNYLRELTDWIRLCVKCHKFFDKYVNTTS